MEQGKERERLISQKLKESEREKIEKRKIERKLRYEMSFLLILLEFLFNIH